MTTEPERRLVAVEAALESETCHCGKVPEIAYEPGATTIRCERCNLQACVPDFDPEKALSEWRRKTN